MIEPLYERKYKGLAREPSKGTQSETANYQAEVAIEGVSANCMSRERFTESRAEAEMSLRYSC